VELINGAYVMVTGTRLKKHLPALKHGGYSRRGVLPGESISDFEKLRDELVAEFRPDGALERDTVATLARLVWRKQNLETFQVAEQVRRRRGQIVKEECARRNVSEPSFLMLSFGETEEALAARREAEQAGEEEARDELGDRYALIETTIESVLEDWEVEERLDAMIDKCVKRLLMLKGVKSLLAAPPSQPAKLPRLRGVDRPAA
jgi:hypothetical protein